jgi:sulfate adenylyltransferase
MKTVGASVPVSGMNGANPHASRGGVGAGGKIPHEHLPGPAVQVTASDECDCAVTLVLFAGPARCNGFRVDQYAVEVMPRVRGLTVFFTGLSGAGKSTLAKTIGQRLAVLDSRPVRLLDGDTLRRRLSSELGFSREHRHLHLERIGFVASEITSCGGIAVCAAIAPYDDARRRVRAAIERVGDFVLVHVATPLSVCEQRDVKGLYARARAGEVSQFTGISDPYEPPADAEIVLDTTHMPVTESANELIDCLASSGYLLAPPTRKIAALHAYQRASRDGPRLVRKARRRS